MPDSSDRFHHRALPIRVFNIP